MSFYKGVFSELNEAIFIHTDKLVWLNGQAVELLGYEELEDVLGLCVLEFVAEDMHEELAQTYSQIQVNNKVEHNSVRLVRRDGSQVTCQVRSSVLKDTEEKFIVTILRPKDISDIDLKLIAFLQTFRHEVNTPLAVLKGYTELTEGKLVDYFDPDVTEFLIVMKRNIERLESLTKRLMTLESIKDGLDEESTEP